ncbi:MAG TPA: T9SS type A sorting domain-containing protein [candidate division Zixibacteria bacterium]|nr:T9SS type A sorting domain-containing protein [candidate division Zixibacteria bacterium]
MNIYLNKEMNMKLVTLLLIMAFAVGLMAISPEDYWPLQIGNSWTTVDSSDWGMDTTVTTIVGTATILGYESYISVDYYEDEADSFYFQYRPDGLYGVSYEDEEYLMEVKYMPRTFSIGDSWTMLSIDTAWTEEGMDYIQLFQINAQAVGFESQTVPAGTFSNCLKIATDGQMTFYLMMGSDTLYSYVSSMGGTIWLGEDIGIVKSIDWDEEEGDTSWDYSYLIDYSLTNIFEGIEKPEISGIHTWPNPFNSACRIATPTGAEVEIFDVTGRLVETLPASEEIIRSWTPSANVPGGVYLIRATIGDEIITSKVLFVK